MGVVERVVAWLCAMDKVPTVALILVGWVGVSALFGWLAGRWFRWLHGDFD